MINRKTRLVVGLAIAAATALVATGCAARNSGSATSSPGTLTIGMTASAIPGLDTGFTANQGAEGIRFVGLSLYDGLTKLDLTQGKTSPKIIGGLATSWTSNSDATKWIFHLRKGVKFTDGSPWDAEGAAFNINRYANPDAPEYDADLHAVSSTLLGGVSSAKVVDDMTVEIDTSTPTSQLPELLTIVPIGSETAIKKLGNSGFAKAPVGSGPFKFKSETRGQQLVLTRNPTYWGHKAEVDTLILKPIPDATARTAALRSGEVNWIEAPNPDEVASLTNAGYVYYKNNYNHIWRWAFDLKKPGPLQDVRVRQALNYAIDRNSLVKNVLAGTAESLQQLTPKADPSYESSNNMYSYDPTKAKALLAAAGYPKGFTMTLSYPTGGSGNMEPQPMNETLQSDLAKVGVTVKLQPVDWSTMLADQNSGTIPGNADAQNASTGFSPPTFWDLDLSSTSSFNIFGYKDAAVDALLKKADATTDDTVRSSIYSEISRKVTADAPWLFVVSDLAGRAMSSSVKGFVEPQSWFLDLTRVSVK